MKALQAIPRFKNLAGWCCCAALLVCFSVSAQAAVVFRDGFGDADRNNDNVVDAADTDTGTTASGPMLLDVLRILIPTRIPWSTTGPRTTK